MTEQDAYYAWDYDNWKQGGMGMGLKHEDFANDPVVQLLEEQVATQQSALAFACLEETNGGDFNEESKDNILRAARAYKIAWYALTLAVAEIIKTGKA